VRAGEDVSFLSALFDFSFERMVTLRVARWVYAAGVALSGFVALAFFLAGLARGGGPALLAVVLAPLGFLVACAYLRLTLEALVVVFRIHEAVVELARKGEPTR
jgi:hypothetical protein